MSGFKEDGSPYRPTASLGARAKLFRHGGSQAVRLPKDFRFEGDEVTIRREGDRVILEPVRNIARTREELKAFWAELDALMDGDKIERPPREIWSDPPGFDD